MNSFYKESKSKKKIGGGGGRKVRVEGEGARVSELVLLSIQI